MTDDPIVEEVRRIRHEHAEKFNNDVAAIFEDYRRLAKEGSRPQVSFPRGEPRDQYGTVDESSQTKKAASQHRLL